MNIQQLASYPDNRVLPFEGVLNFRDMGGYVTEDGRKVKYGIFFRAAELTGMTEKDKEFFKSLGIKTIFDYRGIQEAELKADPAFEGINRIHIPAVAGEVPMDMRDMIKDGYFKKMNSEFASNMYLQMAFDNPSFKRLMETIVDSDNLGLLHHCAGGRDRTGVGSAFILLSLGVPRETIIEDFLISNRTLAPLNVIMKEQLVAFLSPEEADQFINALELRGEYLEALFAAIDSRFGGVESFLEQEFGMTADKLAQLRERCLE